jgi:hypothetical protein
MALDINDFDGDGKPDLALANNIDNTISLFKNRTQGDSIVLSPANNYSTGDSPYSIASGDLSGDGLPDMVVINRSANTMWIYKNRISAPDLRSFSPTTARTGSTVFIYGKNLTGTTSVKFGSIEATSFTVSGDTLVKAIVGSGASGSITVKNQSDNGIISGFTFSTLPDVASYYPVKGTTGTSVEIKGSNFSNASSVSFGKFNAASFKINSDTSITAIVGDVVPGTSPVTVTSPAGKDSLSGFYTGVYLISFAPLSGPINSTVTINGANFSTAVNDNIVFFGGVKGQVLSATNTSLRVKVPAGATNQYISVSVKGSTTYSSRPFAVTFGKGGVDFNANSFQRQTLTGVSAYNSYISDLDGDGKLDLLLVSGQQIFYYKNTSVNDSISFASPGSITVASQASSVCVGDLNADGKPDLSITINAGGYSRLSVWTNTSTIGNISFQFEGRDYTTGISGYEYPQNSAINDLDGDGIPDIAVINSGESFAIFYTINNSGKLVYNGPVSFPKAGGAQTNYLCDLDGDGKPEMITTSTGGNKVSISKNISSAGHILFAPETVYPALNGPVFVSVGDVDGDGKPDIAIGNGNYDYITSFSIMRNTSTLNNISFAPRIDVETGERVKAMAMNDIDGDGKPDLTVVYNSYIPNSMSLYRNTSSPASISFAPKVDYQVETAPTSNLIGDLNDDGKPEIIVTNSATSSVTIFKNQLASLTPAITSYSPESGSLKTVVTIKGSRFSNTSAVAFGNVPATSFAVVSDTVITAILGSGATGEVLITTNEGVATKGGFKYISSPISIYSFSPTSGTTGTHVIIKGANLTNATSVNFGGVAASSFQIVTDTVIDAVVGVGATGTVEVNSSDAKDSLQGFTYIKPVPEMFSFSPASAATGETVRIVGVGFDSTSAVSFGDVAAASFKIISDSVITAVIGRGASGNINITVAGIKISLAGFTYIPPKPQISSFAPASAMLGTTITIKGSGFSEATSVRFGGTEAFSFEVISDSVIKAVVGSGASGKVEVSTKTDTTSLNGFTYVIQIQNDVIQVYPNPSINGYITVKNPSVATTSQINIVDMNGRIVKIIKVDPNTDTTKVNVSSLEKGIYRVVWNDGQQKISLTVLIQ